MGDRNPQATNARQEPGKSFAIVRDGKVVGLFKTAEDAETAIRSLNEPSTAGSQKVIRYLRS
jgi:hypothetical protein